MTRANFYLSLFNYGIFTFPLQNCLNSASSIDAPLGIFILLLLENTSWALEQWYRKVFKFTRSWFHLFSLIHTANSSPILSSGTPKAFQVIIQQSLKYFLLPLLYLCPWDCMLGQVLVCSPVLHWWRGGCARTPPPPCDVLHQRRVDRGFHGDHQYQQRHQHGADRDQDVVVFQVTMSIISVVSSRIKVGE